MNEYSEARMISLNSQFGKSNNGTYNSDVLFECQGLLADENHISRSELYLVNLQIPVSFYMINSTNNVLTYSFSTAPLVMKTITLIQGNYAYDSLMSEVINEFAENGDTFTMGISYLNGCYTFQNSNNLNFTFYFQTSTVFNLLGLGNSNISSTAAFLQAPFPLNLLTINQLVIQSSILSSTGFSSSSTGNGFETLLGTITNDQPPYGLITTQNPPKIGIPLRNRIINEIDIKIYDQNGNFINFVNQQWSLTFALNIYYKVNPIIPPSIHNIISKNTTPLGIYDIVDEYNKDKTKEKEDDDELELLTS